MRAAPASEMDMKKEILLEMVKQNQFTSHFSFDRVTEENAAPRGYKMLKDLVERSSEENWLKPVDTPFFGTVSRIRLFSHILFHNSHHAGQISMTLAKESR
jgi:uncharacterized damage-inducible protein DinB